MPEQTIFAELPAATASHIRHNQFKWRMSFTNYIELRKPPRADGKCALYLRILLPQKKSVRFPLNIAVLPQHFDEAAKRIKKAHPDAEDYNAIIVNYLSAANDIYKKYRLQNHNITPEIFKTEFRINRFSNEDFLKYYLQKMTNDFTNNYISEATFVSEQTTYRKLLRYNGSKPLLFDDINEEYFKKFNAWMVRAKNAQNTRWNNFKHIKKYLKKAADEGVIMQYKFNGFTVPKVAGKINALTMWELKELLKLYYSDNPLLSELQRQCLRIFLFMCHSSVSISDVKKLTWEDNIKNGFIEYVRTKNLRRDLTKIKIVRVPLIETARALIENPRGWLFVYPYMCDQNFNRALKACGALAGIKTNLSSHVARHTFATIYMDNDGHIDVLNNYMGHSNFQDTMRYNHIRNKRLISESEKIGIKKGEDYSPPFP